MPLEALVCEESELALLAIQRRSIINHLGMNLDLVNPLHVVSQLLKILQNKYQFACSAPRVFYDRP
jgi:hypothetical protein